MKTEGANSVTRRTQLKPRKTYGRLRILTTSETLIPPPAHPTLNVSPLLLRVLSPSPAASPLYPEDENGGSGLKSLYNATLSLSPVHHANTHSSSLRAASRSVTEPPKTAAATEAIALGSSWARDRTTSTGSLGPTSATLPLLHTHFTEATTRLAEMPQ